MPVDWSLEKSVQIQTEENDHTAQMKQKKKYKGRIFNDRGQCQIRAMRDNRRDIHEIEGVLEMQKQLLLKLAERGNRFMEANEDETPLPAFLEIFKMDTAQAIKKTWNPRRRSTTHQRSLLVLQ
ncbi:hypothetical protein J3E73DRAFT_259028 [Bipolaris maydis]|nr:hypothetical protein J3E73DRAFT_259028 [Bipolaris maydis]